MPNIVTVNVSQLIAPTPSALQQTGALISQGGTTTVPGTITLLVQPSSLTPALSVPLALTTIAWNSSVVTATAVLAHNLTIGDTVLMVIAGAAPSGYNGTFTATVTTTTAFTYPLTLNPGSSTLPGTYLLESAVELNAMVTTFFAQGNQQSVYVLELGSGNAADGVTYLTAWITANPPFFYSYLVPRAWASASTYWTMVANFESTTAKTYFFTTMTNSNYTNFTPLMKSVFGIIEAPGIPSTEFSLASVFWNTLSYLPSTTNKVTPLSFSFLFGVTPYPIMGNQALLQTYKNAGINYVSTGAEGGISDAMIVWGTMMDLNPFNYWYSVDWMAINCQLNIAIEIINGSNNPINPLYYDQAGINRLESRVAQVVSSGVTFGLVLFQPIQLSLDGPILNQAIDNETYLGNSLVNAVPFIRYSEENPSDYKIGRYSGLSVIFTPARGFTQVIINLLASNFVTI